MHTSRVYCNLRQALPLNSRSTHSISDSIAHGSCALFKSNEILLTVTVRPGLNIFRIAWGTSDAQHRDGLRCDFAHEPRQTAISGY